MRELGIHEAQHKIWQPAQTMVWLGILFNSVEMTMRIPPQKLNEIMVTIESWQVGHGQNGERFPQRVLQCEHNIAHLEMLNVVVAIKTWAKQWSGQRIRVNCDNTNMCLAIQSGCSRVICRGASQFWNGYAA